MTEVPMSPKSNFSKLFLVGIIFMWAIFPVWGATRTWNSSGSTDANNGSNYSPTGALLTTDDIVLSNTSIIDWIQTGNLSVNSIVMNTTYTGNFSMNGYSLTTVKQCYLNGTIGTWTMSGYYQMTGSGNFYLGNFGTFDGRNGTLDLTGGTTNLLDSIGVSKTITYPFKNITMARDSFSSVFIYTPCCPGTMCSHIFTIGRGVVNSQGCAYFTIDPDTSYFLKNTRGSSSNEYIESYFYSACWRSIQIQHNNTGARTLHFPKIYISGASQTQIFSHISDTIIFDDSMLSPGIRFQTDIKSVIYPKVYYGDWSATTLMGTELEFHFGHSNFNTSGFVFSYIGSLQHPIVTFFMDTCVLNYAGSAWALDTSSLLTINRGKSTLNFVNGTDISVKSSSQKFYNVTCSTYTGAKVILLDSMACENKLRIKGKFFAPYPVLTGTFIDSTTDTCKLSSLYLTGDAYLSATSKLQWYPGAVIYAVGTGKQTIYTNSNKIVKVIARKGSKLTVK